jgi:DNA-binding helix-hairpin-helix protein with protein kinase domain
VGRLWIAALGEEALYEADLPGCCQRSARSFNNSFECPECGAIWQAPLPVGSEECVFTERASDGERKGAA